MILMFRVFNIFLCFVLTNIASCVAASNEKLTSQNLTKIESQATPCAEVTDSELNSKSSKDEFRMFIQLKATNWDSTQPLVLCATFKNNSQKSLFLNLKSSFNFEGQIYTENFGSKWQSWQIKFKPSGDNRTRQTDDYLKLLPDEAHTVELISTKITVEVASEKKDSKRIDAHFIPSGKYRLIVIYSAEGQIPAIIASQQVGLRNAHSTDIIIKNSKEVNE